MKNPKKIFSKLFESKKDKHQYVNQIKQLAAIKPAPNSNMEEIIQKLKIKIEQAIEEREETSKRLLFFQRITQHINIYYSCCGAVMSIWSLINQAQKIAFVSVIFSVLLVLLITYIDSRRFSARAKDIDASILDMRNLLAEINCIKNPDNEKILSWHKNFFSYIAASELPYLKLDNWKKYRILFTLVVIVTIITPIIIFILLKWVIK